MASVDGSLKKALQDRRRILLEQPDVRWINLVETDGVNTTTRRHLVRVNQTKNVDHLKNQLTMTFQPTNGAVRNIYTPANGTLVSDLNQIQPQKTYVVGMGNQKYTKIKELLKEHDENKKKILAQLDKQKSGGTPTVKRSVVMPPNRLSLMDRQDLVAQKARVNAIEANGAKLELTKRPPPPNVPKPLPLKGQRKVMPNRRPLFPARRTSATQTPPKEKKRIGGSLKPSGLPVTKPNNGKSPGVNTIIAPIPVPAKNLSRKSTAKKSDDEDSDKSCGRSGRSSRSDKIKRNDSGKSHSSDSRDSSGSRKSGRSGSSRSALSGATKKSRRSVLSRRKESHSSDRDSDSSGHSRHSTKSNKSSARSDRSNRSHSHRSSYKSKSSARSDRSDASTAKSKRTRRRSMSTRKSTAASRNSGSSRESDAITDHNSDSDDDKGKSHRLRYGGTFRGGSVKSHNLQVHASGSGALNDAAPDSGNSSPVRIPDRNRTAFSFSATNSPVSSRSHTRNLVEVDYDTDESGIYRAKSTRRETLGAKVVLESAKTKIDVPVDLAVAEEVKEKLIIN